MYDPVLHGDFYDQFYAAQFSSSVALILRVPRYFAEGAFALTLRKPCKTQFYMVMFMTSSMLPSSARVQP